MSSSDGALCFPGESSFMGALSNCDRQVVRISPATSELWSPSTHLPTSTHTLCSCYSELHVLSKACMLCLPSKCLALAWNTPPWLAHLASYLWRSHFESMAWSAPWTRVWANPGREWRTGKPGELQSMGLQRVRHDWATELNWEDNHL